MFNRDYKEFAPGVFSHIYNRGDNKEIVFRDNQDYRAFLFRLGLGLGIEPEALNENDLTRSSASRIRIKNDKPYLFNLHAFCLMPNHFHLLIEQCGDIPVSSLLLKVGTSFSRYINKKYQRVGHVFQDCFKAVKVTSNPQLMWNSAYIHMNPVKDGIVKNPEDYYWSSFNDFKGRKTSIVTTNFLTGVFGGVDNLVEQTLAFKMSKVPFDTQVV